MERSNTGAIFNGPTAAGIIVAGQGAQAKISDVVLGDVTLKSITETLRERDQEEIARRFEVLAREVRAHAADIPDGADAIEATGAIGTELAKPKPNRLTLKAMLEGVGTAMKTIVSVSEAVSALTHLLH
jgi:hypothetical protein